MFPPIYEIASADSNVQTNLGDPTRLYPFGSAPENVTKPYAVWQTITGIPENYLNQTPDIDTWSIQIDIYGTNQDSVRDAAQAIRDSIEPYAHITSFDGETQDADTRNYRYTLSVDWWDLRESSST